MKILIIVPCFNEEQSLKAVYDSICAYNASHKQKYDFLFVNDGSTDETEKILRLYNINHVSLVQNLGIGGGVQTGYKYALCNNYDIAVQMDGDGQHDVNYVEKIIKPIIDGTADMVIGSRFLTRASASYRSSFFRRIGIRFISWTIWAKTGQRICDTTSGFRAVNRMLIEEFAFCYPTEYPEPISSAYALLNRYVIKEVSVDMHERIGGVSSIRSWNSVYYMINVVLSILLMQQVYPEKRMYP